RNDVFRHAPIDERERYGREHDIEHPKTAGGSQELEDASLARKIRTDQQHRQGQEDISRVLDELLPQVDGPRITGVAKVIDVGNAIHKVLPDVILIELLRRHRKPVRPEERRSDAETDYQRRKEGLRRIEAPQLARWNRAVKRRADAFCDGQ